MSDDFDKDDLSWLRDDDDDDDEPEEEENLDWQKDDEKPAAPPGGHLGFTGELPWMQEEDAGADEAPLGDDFDLDWMREPDAPEVDDEDWLAEEEESAEPGASPMTELSTGEFEAAQPPPESEEEEPAAGISEWLTGTDEDEIDIGALADLAEQAREVPEWLKDTGDLWGDEPEGDVEEPPLEELVPDWLQGDEAEAEEEDLLKMAPDWLEEAGASAAPMKDDTGAISEEWLSSGDLLPETGDSEQTFDEWIAAQAEAERPLDLEEQLPSMSDLAMPEADAGDMGSGEVPDWFLGMEEMDTSDAPDWFVEDAEAANAQPEGAPSADEMDAFFDSLGDVPSPEAVQYEQPLSFEDMFGSETEDEEIDPSAIPDGQILQALGIEAPDETPDWFGEEEAESSPDEMGWLDELGEIDELALVEAEDDFTPHSLADVMQAAEAEEPEAADEVDELLAAMDFEGMPLPDTGDLLAEDADFDTLFSDPAFSDVAMEAPAAEEDEFAPEAPDWLTEAGATVGEFSAAAILRQQNDRPLEELPDRLKHLRERGQSIPTTEDDSEAYLPEVGEAADAVTMGPTGMAVVLTPQQELQVDLLRDLTAGAQTEQPSGSWTFDEDPFMLDEDETLAEGPVEAVAAPRRRLSERVKIDRLLIALLLFILMSLPFVSDVQIGDLPPHEFGANSRQQAVFDSLEHLAIDDRVLVGVEYGPTAAGELDSLARVLFQHILERHAQPVVVSSNPIALLRANNLLAELGASDSPLLATLGRNTALNPDQDYYVVRYLSGSALGIRALSENIGSMLATDMHGQPTNLNIKRLDQFAQIVVIAEQPEDLWAWAEHVAPLNPRPMLAATGKLGEPLIEPYLGSALNGLLVGYQDALTYSAMLGSSSPAPLIEARPTEIPSPTPTAVPLPTEVLPAGTINTGQTVNVRSGPGETFPIEGAANPGDIIGVIGGDNSGTWLNVRLPDGSSGWIRADLVQVEQPTNTPAPTETPTLPSTETPIPSDTPPPSGTPPPTDTPQPSATPSDTATPTITHTPRSLPPTWTPEASATSETTVTARIIASERVNIRSGPGTTFSSVGTAGPGDTFPVIGRNADGSWIQIEYPDLVEGQEAWIAAFLVDVQAQAAYQPQGILVAMVGPGYGLLAQDEASPSAEVVTEVPTATEIHVTPTATQVEATPTAMLAEVMGVLPSGEARWNAMTLGLLFIIGVIILGALVNIVRALSRRGQ